MELTNWLAALHPELADIDKNYRVTPRDVAAQMMLDLQATLRGDDWGHNYNDALYIGACACEALAAAALTAELSETAGDGPAAPWLGLAWWRLDVGCRWTVIVCTSQDQMDAMTCNGAAVMPLQADDPEDGTPAPARAAVLTLIGDAATKTQRRWR